MNRHEVEQGVLVALLVLALLWLTKVLGLQMWG